MARGGVGVEVSSPGSYRLTVREVVIPRGKFEILIRRGLMDAGPRNNRCSL